MMKIFSFSILCVSLGFLSPIIAEGRDYVVAVDGSDAGDGTVANPLGTLRYAVSLVDPGDRILLRGGTHFLDQTVRITRSGTASQRISLEPYEDETAIIDGSQFTVFDSDLADNSNLMLNGCDYWDITGIEVREAPFYGIHLRSGANHNRLERLKVYDNGGTGVEIVSGSGNNLILNVDSYRNFDPDDNGQDADGFSAKFDVGIGNVFRGCRAWGNSDDGWDFWRAGNTVVVEQCWAFDNGFDIWDHGPSFEGNGNGFKLGQGEGEHLLTNNLAWGNSTRGFDDNNNVSGSTLYNNTAWNNPTNYRLDTGALDIAKNNLSYQGSVALAPDIAAGNNSWDLGLEFTGADFLTLDDALSKAERDANGGLPHSGFLRLVKTGQAIDRGVDVGLPFAGAAPDLGFYEWGIAEAGATSIPAESLDLVGYEIEGRSEAEGQSVLKGFVNQTNTGQFLFSGATGSYDIGVRYLDESDGVSTLELRVGNVLVGAWQLDTDDEAYQTRWFNYVEIATGATVQITGIADGGEHVRIDSIEITEAIDLNDIITFSVGTFVDEDGAVYLELSYTRPDVDNGRTYIAQTTTDLRNWPVDSTGVDPIPSILDNGDGTKTWTYRRTQPITSSAPGFMRVQISDEQ